LNKICGVVSPLSANAIAETDLNMPVVCPYAIADVLERNLEVGEQ